MEQVAIGIGAKMGNGLLLTVLGWLLLIEANAPLADRAVFVLLLSSALAIAFTTLVRSPERAWLLQRLTGRLGTNGGPREVARAGIEPATPRFSAVCSTN